MAATEDYYSLLGVSKAASEDELKRAYRQLARELHPDANGGDPVAEARFKEVTIAYETLRDPERRRRYDMFGPDGARGSGGGGAAGGDFGFVGGIGDLFDAFFTQAGGGRASSRAHQGADAETVVDLSLHEAVFGARRAIEIRLPVTCATCAGSGATAGTTATTCSQCRGAGQLQRVRQSILGQMVTATACTRCAGTGEVVSSPCAKCRGEGRINEVRSVTVDVPAGVDEGATLRVSGAGAAPLRGGPPGDLYVHLRVTPHERFERSGNDLATVAHISVAQAALGSDLELETLDGPSTVTIPAGSQTGRVLKIAGHGVPRLRGGRRGDLLVQLFVDTPVELTKEEDELLRRLADLRGEPVAAHDPGLFARIRSALS